MDSHAREFGGAAPWNVQTRESLLRRVRDWSDDAGWQEFFDLYWRMIYSLAVRSGLTEAEAEDVVQTTMVAVADNIRRFEYDPEIGSFKNWLCHQARWKIADQLRRRRREEQHIARRSPAPSTRTDTIARIADQRDSLDQLIEEDWDKTVTAMALNRIKSQVKPKHFQMFDLYVMKSWPIRRVSQTLQVNVAQIYLAKSRILRLLKKQVPLVEEQLVQSLRNGGISKQKL